MNQFVLSARKAIESQYDGYCDIVEYQEVLKDKSTITSHKEVIIKKNIPCKISFEDIYSNTETNNESVVATKVKLFIAPEIDIKPGSKIIVNQKNRITEYKNSGEPAVYDTHQEIMLVNFKGWA